MMRINDSDTQTSAPIYVAPAPAPLPVAPPPAPVVTIVTPPAPVAAPTPVASAPVAPAPTTSTFQQVDLSSRKNINAEDAPDPVYVAPPAPAPVATPIQDPTPSVYTPTSNMEDSDLNNGVSFQITKKNINTETNDPAPPPWNPPPNWEQYTYAESVLVPSTAPVPPSITPALTSYLAKRSSTPTQVVNGYELPLSQAAITAGTMAMANKISLMVQAGTLDADTGARAIQALTPTSF